MIEIVNVDDIDIVDIVDIVDSVDIAGNIDTVSICWYFASNLEQCSRL